MTRGWRLWVGVLFLLGCPNTENPIGSTGADPDPPPPEADDATKELAESQVCIQCFGESDAAVHCFPEITCTYCVGETCDDIDTFVDCVAAAVEDEQPVRIVSSECDPAECGDVPESHIVAHGNGLASVYDVDFVDGARHLSDVSVFVEPPPADVSRCGTPICVWAAYTGQSLAATCTDAS